MYLQALSLFESSFDKIIPEDWAIRLTPRFLTYKPRYNVVLETPNYRMSTASSVNDLIELFKLRYDCFLREVQKEEGIKFDYDELDSLCDHLVIKSKLTNEIVGTYRMITEATSSSFYSQSEFHLDDFLALPGVKVELGRACIHPEHRNGNIMDLLWRGIGKYCELTGAKYLFGCSSVYTTSPNVSLQLVNYFNEKQQYSEDFNIHPIGKYQMSLNTNSAHLFDEDIAKRFVPPLLRSYLNAGAKVYGHPALDEDFECIDFLTIMNLDDMHSSFKRRYFKV